MRLTTSAQPQPPSDLLATTVLPTKEELLGLFKYLTPPEREEIERIVQWWGGRWLPLPGPQTKAFYCEAQNLGYGGAAGGGKTDLIFGASYEHHHRSILFRREYQQLVGIIERSHEVFDTLGKYNGFWKSWYFNDEPGHKLEFGACEHLGDERKFQGRAHDCKGFDEVTHLAKPQFDYLRGWNRTVIPGQKCQVIATFNPPTKAEERWILEVWPNWLDRLRYPNPHPVGELLYFITDQGQRIQVDGPGRHTYKNKIKFAQSYTFIPSKVTDNLYLDDGQYEGVLDSLPEPLRSQLLDGDFQAGMSDDEWQLLPTPWLMAAMQRWRNMEEPDWPINQVGLDVSRGGIDRTVATARKRNYFCKQEPRPGKLMKDGDACLKLVMPMLHSKTIVVIDETGVGSAAYDAIKKHHKPDLVIGFLNGGESVATDTTGYFSFVNQLAEAGWALREALDPKNKQNLAIPWDMELLADLQSWK